MTQITATLVDHMGSDLSTVNAARVSFAKSHAEFDPVRDTKLIKYLAKHRHTSPFGHAFASFHCKAPLFVHAQLLKHKFLRSNTISRRYVDDNIEFYVPDVWRGRSADKKQGSEGEVTSDTLSYDFAYYGMEQPLVLYKKLLYDGVAPEMARMVLPQSTMTEFYWSGSLDAFADMCRLRCAHDTQYESQLVANQISEKLGTLYPVSFKALMEN